MAVVVIISGLGALNGWTMICAEMPLAAAKDGLFPEQFERLERRGVPAFGIIASTALASIAMIINYLGLERRDRVHDPGADDRHHRGDPLRVLRPGADQVAPRRPPARCETPRFVRDMVVAVLSLVFSVLFIWYSRNTGSSFWFYWAPFLLAGGALLLGIPVYRRQRSRMTEPEPVPDYR